MNDFDQLMRETMHDAAGAVPDPGGVGVYLRAEGRRVHRRRVGSATLTVALVAAGTAAAVASGTLGGQGERSLPVATQSVVTTSSETRASAIPPPTSLPSVSSVEVTGSGEAAPEMTVTARPMPDWVPVVTPIVTSQVGADRLIYRGDDLTEAHFPTSRIFLVPIAKDRVIAMGAPAPVGDPGPLREASMWVFGDKQASYFYTADVIHNSPPVLDANGHLVFLEHRAGHLRLTTRTMTQDSAGNSSIDLGERPAWEEYFFEVQADGRVLVWSPTQEGAQQLSVLVDTSSGRVERVPATVDIRKGMWRHDQFQRAHFEGPEGQSRYLRLSGPDSVFPQRWLDRNSFVAAYQDGYLFCQLEQATCEHWVAHA